ncbi:MAG TPA: molybdenum cofactor biosynthesis protein MoaE [Polyangiaceae bacterium]|nr:molybdenum cofactor biosynthesis protein MoaE [Polyangiaceae bacterium]
MTTLVGIRDTTLNTNEVERAVAADHAGAIVTFIGQVRAQNAGLVVTRLEYEAYPSMAEKEMASIVRELEAKFPGTRLAVLHRIGSLSVGEAAVVCSASAEHREEAFTACHALIDEIKARVPIWKREHGPNGPYWVGWEDARCVGHGSDGDPAVTQRNGDAARQTDPQASMQAQVSESAYELAKEEPKEEPTHVQATRNPASQDPLPVPPTTVSKASASCCHHHGASDHARHSSTGLLRGWRVAAVTVSDTRRVETDESGRLLEQLFSQAGAHVERRLVRDDAPSIAALVEEMAANTIEAVVLSGGTGIGPRDVTYEAIRPLLDRQIEGFGEAFRRLSFDSIGTRALLSRAIAGVRANSLIFAVPGSPKAVTLAIEQLVMPLLPHARAMLLGGGH